LRDRNLQVLLLEPIVPKLSNLTDLRLGRNAMFALPDWVGGLPHLRELEAEDNELGSLPA
jgi:Leucine-rich repeat (LRR) protein